LLPLLAAVLMVPRLFLALTRLHFLEVLWVSQLLKTARGHFSKDSWVSSLLSVEWGCYFLPIVFLVVGTVLTIWAISYVSLAFSAERDKRKFRDFLRGCLLPLLGAALTLSLDWSWLQSVSCKE